MLLPINEVIPMTIQGEAYWAGTPSTFVRLQQCPVGCPWCDTKHTWELKPEKEDNVFNVLRKTEDSETYAFMNVEQIAGQCKQRHVVLTGGEPAIYDLRELSGALIESGKSVQVETSGTFDLQIDYDAWVTLSPKIDMPGGLKVLQSVVERANEIKMPVGKKADIEKLESFLEEHLYLVGFNPIIWLQPLSQSEKATALCIEAAAENGWRLSLQLHKFIGVR